MSQAIHDILGAPPALSTAHAPTRVLETIALRFLARIIHADGKIDPKEYEMLVQVAAHFELAEAEAKKILDDELKKHSDCAVLAAQIPDRMRRRELYAMGCMMSLADGECESHEREVLAAFAKGAQIPVADADAILNEVLRAAGKDPVKA